MLRKFYLNNLGMNFELDFKMIDDPKIKLSYFGEYLYNNIIFFAPSYNEGKKYLIIELCFVWKFNLFFIFFKQQN